MPSTTLPFSPDSEFAPNAALSPALLQDVARIFRQLGVQSFRASVVDSESMSFQAAWSISDSGEFHDSDRPVDSTFPGAASVLAQLANTGLDQTAVQKLSPSRWRLAWRFDGPHVLVADAHFRDRRATLSEVDTALVRLVCGIGIRAAQTEAPVAALSSLSMAWPKAERRVRSKQASSWLGLSLLLGAVLLTGWLAFAAVPEELQANGVRQTELAQLRAMADKTMVQGLSAALASGDYGEVQTVLTSFNGLGYFSSAVVTNGNQRIVSLAGKPDGLRIGDPLPPRVARAARTFDLSVGSERLGQLLVAPVRPVAPAEAPAVGLRLLVTLAFVASAATAVLMLWRQRRRWPRRARRKSSSLRASARGRENKARP